MAVEENVARIIGYLNARSASIGGIITHIIGILVTFAGVIALFVVKTREPLKGFTQRPFKWTVF